MSVESQSEFTRWIIMKRISNDELLSGHEDIVGLNPVLECTLRNIHGIIVYGNSRLKHRHLMSAGKIISLLRSRGSVPGRARGEFLDAVDGVRVR